MLVSGSFYRVKVAGLTAICFLVFALLRYMAWDSDYTDKTVGLKQYNFKNITSIQYQQLRETYGNGDGKEITNTNIAYVYPDKMRIENSGETKTIEIYNNDKYIYYDGVGNTIKVKECFPPDKPYVSEIEERMSKILENGGYEFFGYEEIDDKNTEVIGITSKIDGQSYMHKIWLAEINKVNLPLKEEYFINNSVVSKTTYTYLKVNEPINPSIFDKSTLPKVSVINDGVLPKYVESMEEAQKYLNFKLIIPQRVDGSLIISETAVIPPAKKPSFYCIYMKDGYRIYMNEKQDKVSVKENAILGKLPCEFTREDEKVTIAWEQNNLYIILSGDESLVEQIIKMAEEMANGKLVMK